MKLDKEKIIESLPIGKCVHKTRNGNKVHQLQKLNTIVSLSSVTTVVISDNVNVGIPDNCFKNTCFKNHSVHSECVSFKTIVKKIF